MSNGLYDYLKKRKEELKNTPQPTVADLLKGWINQPRQPDHVIVGRVGFQFLKEQFDQLAKRHGFYDNSRNGE